jgi:hypothetical protein
VSPRPSRIAHYTVTAKRGEGGMGAVYRATDTKLNRDVAIKVLPDSFAADPDRLARFTREAQVLAQLNHPNIAAIYGVEDRALVLELVDGPEVAGPIDPDDALPLLHQLIDALEDPLDPAKRKASPYFETAYNVAQGQFSPGPAGSPRWVAYTSDESKQQPEVYVQSFPTGAGKFQISNAGGTQPRWRRDGKELFYMDRDGNVMAVDVKTSPGFQAGVPRPLFHSRLSNPMAAGSFRFDVTPDGRRFLVNAPAQSDTAAEPITVVTNWQAAGKR